MKSLGEHFSETAFFSETIIDAKEPQPPISSTLFFFFTHSLFYGKCLKAFWGGELQSP
jgi:hypothetical protein